MLLNEFEATCEAAGWPAETRELAESSRIGHVVAKSARKALIELSATKRAGDAVPGDLAEDLRDLFVEIGRAAQANGRGFALIIDEMQNLPKSDLGALIVGLHRAKQKGRSALSTTRLREQL